MWSNALVILLLCIVVAIKTIQHSPAPVDDSIVPSLNIFVRLTHTKHPPQKGIQVRLPQWVSVDVLLFLYHREFHPIPPPLQRKKKQKKKSSRRTLFVMGQRSVENAINKFP
jgi:hypothetical protein